MARNKTPITKERIGKALKQNRRVPLFAIAASNRRVVVNSKRRRWRNETMKLPKEKGAQNQYKKA